MNNATLTGQAACRCGARVYATQAEAEKAEPEGRFKCPRCGTFARDHEFYGSEDSDFRCYDCDVRSGSHGNPPSALAAPLAKAIAGLADLTDEELELLRWRVMDEARKRIVKAAAR